MNYNDKNWIRKRNQVLKRDNFTCRGCSSKENLQCHHSYYVGNRKLWHYPLSSFLTLCKDCHQTFHDKIKGKELAIKCKIKIADKEAEEIKIGFNINNILRLEKLNSTKKHIAKKAKVNKKPTVKPKKAKPICTKVPFVLKGKKVLKKEGQNLRKKRFEVFKSTILKELSIKFDVDKDSETCYIVNGTSKGKLIIYPQQDRMKLENRNIDSDINTWINKFILNK